MENPPATVEPTKEELFEMYRMCFLIDWKDMRSVEAHITAGLRKILTNRARESR